MAKHNTTSTATYELHEMSNKTLASVKVLDNIPSQPQQIINNLPPELLGHIFVCTQTRQNTREALTPLKVGEPLTVTQVCRHWRQVALCTPHLWSHIHIPHPNDQLAIESLLRSGALPLRICLVNLESDAYEYPKPTNTFKALDLLLVNIHRTEKFSIHTDWPCDSPNWTTLNLTSAKILKSLQLSTTNTFQPLPVDLFGSLPPAVEELILYNYSPLLPCDRHFQFHNLRKLDLHNSGNGPSASLHFCDYLPLISSSSRLEHILISQTSEAPSPPEPSPNNIHFFDTSTPLPRLRSLILGSKTPKMDDILQFLSCIQIPNKASRHIFTSSWSEWPETSLSNLVTKARFGGDSVHTLLGRPIRRLKIISSKIVDGQKAFGLDVGTLTFTANLSWSVRNSLLRSGLLSEVETLVCTDLPGYYSTAELRPLFAGLPSLRQLTISDNTPSSIAARVADALGPLPVSAPSGKKRLDGLEQVNGLPCPLLESIHCLHPSHEPDIRQLKQPKTVSEVPVGDGSKLALLAEERAGRGSPLKHVVLEHCREEDVVRLHQHIEIEGVKTPQAGRHESNRVDFEAVDLQAAFDRMQPPS